MLYIDLSEPGQWTGVATGITGVYTVCCVLCAVSVS